MKKILLATALISFGSMAFAAGGADNPLGANPGGGGATTIIAGATAGAGVCTLLNTGSTLKVTLSAGNVGSISCDATTANIGVAMGNLNGKGNVYSIGSTGGGITVTGGATDLSEATVRGVTVTQSDNQSAKTS